MLALLEQMEVLAVMKPLVVFMMLDVIKKGEMATLCIGHRNA